MSEILDVQGLSCPLPVLRAKKAMRTIEVGQVLTVLATDPNAAKDFPTFCRQTGHELVSAGEADGVWRFEIRRTT